VSVVSSILVISLSLAGGISWISLLGFRSKVFQLIKAGSTLPDAMVANRRSRQTEIATEIDTDNAADERKPEPQLFGFRAVYVFERLSRDLWPSLCALDVIRECHFSKSLDSSSHIIAQLIYPAQHSPMRGWFSSLPSGLKPTRQHARICSAAAMFRTVA